MRLKYSQFDTYSTSDIPFDVQDVESADRDFRGRLDDMGATWLSINGRRFHIHYWRVISQLLQLAVETKFSTLDAARSAGYQTVDAWWMANWGQFRQAILERDYFVRTYDGAVYSVSSTGFRVISSDEIDRVMFEALGTAPIVERQIRYRGSYLRYYPILGEEDMGISVQVGRNEKTLAVLSQRTRRIEGMDMPDRQLKMATKHYAKTLQRIEDPLEHLRAFASLCRDEAPTMASWEEDLSAPLDDLEVDTISASIKGLVPKRFWNKVVEDFATSGEKTEFGLVKAYARVAREDNPKRHAIHLLRFPVLLEALGKGYLNAA